MSRRFALACTFGFTMVVTFALVAVANSTGWFASSPEIESTEAAMEAPNLEPADVDEPVEAPTRPEPIVITEYVYVDVLAPAITPSTQVSPTPTMAVPTPIPPVPNALTLSSTEPQKTSADASVRGSTAGGSSSKNSSRVTPSSRSLGGSREPEDKDHEDEDHESEDEHD
jgi:hypothetical protein